MNKLSFFLMQVVFGCLVTAILMAITSLAAITPVEWYARTTALYVSGGIGLVAAIALVVSRRSS